MNDVLETLLTILIPSIIVSLPSIISAVAANRSAKNEAMKIGMDTKTVSNGYSELVRVLREENAELRAEIKHLKSQLNESQTKESEV